MVRTVRSIAQAVGAAVGNLGRGVGQAVGNFAQGVGQAVGKNDGAGIQVLPMFVVRANQVEDSEEKSEGGDLPADEADPD